MIEPFEPEQEYEIVARLHDATESGRITWDTEGTFRFVTSAGGTTRFTIVSTDEDDRAPFVLTVYSGDTPVGEIETIPTGTDFRRKVNNLLASIYRLAKRQALQMDAAVSRVLEDLRSAVPGDIPPIPEGPTDDDVPF